MQVFYDVSEGSLANLDSFWRQFSCCRLAVVDVRLHSFPYLVEEREGGIITQQQYSMCLAICTHKEEVYISCVIMACAC